MKMLNLLLKNLMGSSVTVRFPQRPPVDQGFRGLVRYDPALCTGCAMCAYRCTSHAITFKSTRAAYTWSYDPGQCTYCGRCVDGCPAHALTQDAMCPPIYLDRDELKYSHTKQRPQPAKKKTAPAAAASDASAAPISGEGK